jgi:hypothetical protein
MTYRSRSAGFSHVWHRFSWSLPLVRDYGEEPPLIENARQAVQPSILESNSRAGHEILDRTGYEHLTWPGHAPDSRPDVHRNPSEFLTHTLTLAGMDADPYFDPKLPQGRGDRAGTAYGSCGTIECREQPIARCVDQPTPETFELASRQVVMSEKEFAPASVAELSGKVCGIHNVGEQDGREDSVRVRNLTGTGHELLDISHRFLKIIGPQAGISA